MNGLKLLEQVSALGFESETEANTAFIVCANRALQQIFSEREVQSIVKIPVICRAPAMRIPSYHHLPGASDSFSLSGAAYSFTVSGKGEYTVKDGSGVHTHSFDTRGSDARGFLSGSGVITFSGAFAYSVFDLAAYTDIYGEEVSSIPVYSANEHYRISDFAPDFISPIGSPYSEEGALPSSIKINGDMLTVPVDHEGEIYIRYARAPREITLDNLDEEIDIMPECEHLLALLAAVYLWLDDDGDKAQYYMSIYRNGIDAIRRWKNRSAGGEFEDVLGWA